jgi:hypothetical protein
MVEEGLKAGQGYRSSSSWHSFNSSTSRGEEGVVMVVVVAGAALVVEMVQAV